VTGIPYENVFEVADSIFNAIIDSCESMFDFDIKYRTKKQSYSWAWKN